MSQTTAIHIPKRSVEREVLSNGTTILYTPNPYNQIVAIRIFCRMASRHETAEKAGMANLCLRLLSSGTEHHSEEEIAENLERNGANFKAEAGKDWGSVDLQTTVEFLVEDLQTVLELIDCPTFPEEKLVRERETVRMNILEQDDSLLHYTMRVFRRHYYGTHPYGWPSIGLVETLDAIQREDLVQFAHAAFDPSQLVVSVTGGTDGDTREIIRKAFASRAVRNSNSETDSPAPRIVGTDNRDVIEHRESEAEYIVMGYPGCGIHDESAIPLRIISAVLGGSMDSRLFREIRDKRGLCYQIGSSFAPQKDHSPLLIYLVTSPRNRQEAVTCTQAEVERLKQELVPSDELERIKTYVCGTYVMSLESNMGQASCYGTYELAGLGWDFANLYPEQVYAVTPEQVQETARQLFTHRLLTITAPSEKKKKRSKK